MKIRKMFKENIYIKNTKNKGKSLFVVDTPLVLRRCYFPLFLSSFTFDVSSQSSFSFLTSFLVLIYINRSLPTTYNS